MAHRHLLPNEIDLLVDGEAGFGVAELRAHVAECAECAARLVDARLVAVALEVLPHFAPDSRLGDRVMAHVPVFVPAHVAARDTVRRWLPRSGRARIAASVLGSAVAGAFTVALAWLAMRGDAVFFVGGMLGDRLRTTIVGAVHDLTLALLGESAVAALQASGAAGAALLAVGLIAAALVTVVGLRRLAVASTRRG
jgi:hypothetical protein